MGPERCVILDVRGRETGGCDHEKIRFSGRPHQEDRGHDEKPIDIRSLGTAYKPIDTDRCR